MRKIKWYHVGTIAPIVVGFAYAHYINQEVFKAMIVVAIIVIFIRSFIEWADTDY